MNSVLWKSYMSALREAENSVRGDAVLRVRYEELVKNPGDEVERICRHVGVPFDPAMIEIERMNSSFDAGTGYSEAKGLYRESLERWRDELSATEVWLGERVFGSAMRDLGYEPAAPRPRPSVVELARILLHLPGRLYNMLFRGHKPFRLAKVRRVLSNLRSG